MVIKSQRVLKMAVAKGRLPSNQPFAVCRQTQSQACFPAKQPCCPAAAKDANTTLIQISYKCNDADLAAAVVNAVVDGYSDYLSAEFRSNGSEIYNIVKEAQDNLLRRTKI